MGKVIDFKPFRFEAPKTVMVCYISCNEKGETTEWQEEVNFSETFEKETNDVE